MNLARLIGRAAADVAHALGIGSRWRYRENFVDVMVPYAAPEWVWSHEDDDISTDTLGEIRAHFRPSRWPTQPRQMYPNE